MSTCRNAQDAKFLLVYACRSLRRIAGSYREAGNEAHSHWLDAIADDVEAGYEWFRGANERADTDARKDDAWPS